jgi:hypothetical protein
MPLSSSNAQRQLSDGNSQGTVLGQSATDLIGFYGVTTASARISIGGVSISSGALASTLIYALQTYGLINVSTAPTA